MNSKRKFIKENGILTQQGKDTFATLQRQCSAEYDLCWRHQKPKKDEAEVRLKLYNNQKRDKKAVGDTTLFTIFQTVLASLYVDRLDSVWEGKEQGDEEVAENLIALSKSDYDDMEKDISDYDWLWDTGFFGRGLLLMQEYERDPDKNIFLPLPYILDPITFLRDPVAKSVNGDVKMRGSMRFGGYEVKLTRNDMEENPHIFDDISFRDIKFGSGTQSILQDSIEARNEAQGHQDTSRIEQEELLGANGQYTLTEWYTHWLTKESIKKVKVWLANDRTKVVGIQILKDVRWPIIDRPLYPTSHDWDGTSIPDIVEDKQRGRAIAQNLGLNAMKADLLPSYLFDTNKITNRKDLRFGFNKFIPVDSKGEPLANAILPMVKARPNMGLLDFIYNSLDASAQRATATPELQQGAMSQEKRTLGEINIIASKVDTRYSLSAKVLGWSERRFWLRWYKLHKDNFAEGIDEKVLRTVGAFGPKWRSLKRDNIITKRLDPDVKIESRVLSRAKQLEERQSLTSYFSLALQEPNSNRRWGLKKLAKLNGLEKDEIDRLFPQTIDEREAEAENELLNKNKPAKVLREQDHNIHLEIHSKANETKASTTHIKTHEQALMIRRTNPEFFPEMPNETAMNPPGSSQIQPIPGQGAKPNIQPSQTSGQAIPMTA